MTKKHLWLKLIMTCELAAVDEAYGSIAKGCHGRNVTRDRRIACANYALDSYCTQCILKGSPSQPVFVSESYRRWDALDACTLPHSALQLRHFAMFPIFDISLNTTA